MASFLADHIDRSLKTQTEIALEAGFERSNIISMLKGGITKLPLVRVPALAKAIGANPTILFRLCMDEYSPDLLAVCDMAYDREQLTEFECQVLHRIRTVAPPGKALLFNRQVELAVDDLVAASGIA